MKKFNAKAKKEIKIIKPIKGLIESKFELLPFIFTGLDTIFGEESTKLALGKTITAHNNIVSAYGVRQGTKRWKAMCNTAICKIEGRDPAEPSFSVGRTDGWPKSLGHLRPYRNYFLDESNSEESRTLCYRWIITLSKINSVCSDNNFLDVNDIKKTFVIPSELEKGFEAFLEERLKDNVITDNISQLVVERPLFGSSNGPNGISKSQSATHEAIELLSSQLGTPFREYCELTGNNDFLNYVEGYAKSGNEKDVGWLNKDKIFLRKLTAIADKGNKSRTIAICDFWTQSLLEPLERNEQRQLLKNFKSKTAFLSHADGFQKVLATYNEDWISIDASQWTDNFPSRLQYIYLKKRYGKQLAYSWRKLVVDCPWNITASADTVIYGKGQGMGTKGSFMIASITDHYFIEYISTKNYGKVCDYNKVGDDLVICDKKKIFLEEYPKIGVEVNISKTKCSTTKGNFVEYVSRVGWNKNDASQISPNLVQRVHRQPLLFPVLVKHIKERNPNFSSSDSFELINKLNLKETERDRVILLTALHQSLSGESIIDLPSTHITSDILTNKTIFNCLVRLIKKYDSVEEEIFNLGEKYDDIDNREYGESLVNDFLMSEQTLLRFATEKKLQLHDILLLTMSLDVYMAKEDEVAALEQQPKIPRPVVGYDLSLNDHEFPNMVIDKLVVSEGKRLSIKLIDSFNPQSPRNSRTLVHYFKALNAILKEELLSPLEAGHKTNLEYEDSSQLLSILNREVPYLLFL